jgi:hypothetical protein
MRNFSKAYPITFQCCWRNVAFPRAYPFTFTGSSVTFVLELTKKQNNNGRNSKRYEYYDEDYLRGMLELLPNILKQKGIL